MYTVQDVRAIADQRGRLNLFKIVTPARLHIISSLDQDERAEAIHCIQKYLPKQQNGIRGPAHANSGMAAITDALLSRYERLKVIGSGGFSTVYLVRKTDTKKYMAMKVIMDGAQKKKNLAQETLILARVNHPFLIKMHCTFQTEQAVYFVMDFVNGGSLYYHLKKDHGFPEERTRFYTAEIVCGIEYLHQTGIVYRDLKPENILLSHEGHIVLTDFGLSKSQIYGDEARTTTRCGTPQYVAPEVVIGEEYTKSVDWWSLGAVLYEMMFGSSPFACEDEMEIYERIVNADYTIPETMTHNGLPTPKTASSLIMGFLEKDPAHRLSDPAKIKKHPFFKTINWKKLMSLQVTPPFVPVLEKGPADTSYVDQKLLSLKVEPSSDNTLVSSYSDFTLPDMEDDASSIPSKANIHRYHTNQQLDEALSSDDGGFDEQLHQHAEELAATENSDTHS
eukprot:TRINITY_DN1295_c0_g1_i1.p1 TRINITY_DN1295_c0_g1~~TRINITY_DN1295_c0_g1_i1.p1  ORF type:complete len:450 (+),score=85.90 TRINITY_DN1295_c0_g1_i1:491-1840(+)